MHQNIVVITYNRKVNLWLHLFLLYDNKMKTAICLSGELRSIDKCIDGWKEKILPKLGEYDLFYFAWDDDPDKSKLKYLNQLNLKDIIIEPRKTFHEKMYVIRKRPEVNVQGLLRQTYCLGRCNDIKRKYEKKNDFIYDCVVRLRPDILIEPDAVFPEVVTLDLNELHVFKHDAWFGYNDRVYFSNSKNMNIVDNRFSFIDDHFYNNGIFHYEILFKAAADKNKINSQKHDFRFKLLRTNGSESYCWENDVYWSKMWSYPQLT